MDFAISVTLLPLLCSAGAERDIRTKNLYFLSSTAKYRPEIGVTVKPGELVMFPACTLAQLWYTGLTLLL